MGSQAQRKFVKYDVQICRFWCILTAAQSLDTSVFMGRMGLPKNLYSVLCKSHESE